jgi:hypothetical protein
VTVDAGSMQPCHRTVPTGPLPTGSCPLGDLKPPDVETSRRVTDPVPSIGPCGGWASAPGISKRRRPGCVPGSLPRQQVAPPPAAPRRHPNRSHPRRSHTMNPPPFPAGAPHRRRLVAAAAALVVLLGVQHQRFRRRPGAHQRRGGVVRRHRGARPPSPSTTGPSRR